MSQRQSGYARQARELYETPAWVTECLLGHIRTRPGSIWEPAAGSGQMLRVLSGEFLTLASDVAPAPGRKGVDFLGVDKLPSPAVRGIITNPPYKQAQEFCEHALDLTRPVGGFVAMLLLLQFDSAKTRRHLFAEHPAWHAKITLTQRIVWFVEANGKPKASPSDNHAWYVWDWSRPRAPATIAYAP